MNVQKIAANVRYSKAIGDGEHKTIELGAEALVMPGESWQDVQGALYKALGAQLRTCWAANGHPASCEPPAPAATIPSAPAEKVPEHFCKVHGVAFQRKWKGDRVWYSHRTAEGKWCPEL